MASKKQYPGESRRAFNSRKKKKGPARKKANRAARSKYK